MKNARLVAAALEAEGREEGADLIKIEVGSNAVVQALAPKGAKRYLMPARRTTLPRDLSSWPRTVRWAERRAQERGSFYPRFRFRRHRRTVSPLAVLVTALSGSAIGWFATQFVPVSASFAEGLFSPVYMLAALLVAAVFGIAHSRESSLNKTIWLKLHLLTHFWVAFGGMLTSAATEGTITPFSAWSLGVALTLLAVLGSQLRGLSQSRQQALVEARQRVQLAWLAEHESPSPMIDFSHRQSDGFTQSSLKPHALQRPENREAMVLEEVYEEEEV